QRHQDDADANSEFRLGFHTASKLPFKCRYYHKIGCEGAVIGVIGVIGNSNGSAAGYCAVGSKLNKLGGKKQVISSGRKRCAKIDPNEHREAPRRPKGARCGAALLSLPPR